MRMGGVWVGGLGSDDCRKGGPARIGCVGLIVLGIVGPKLLSPH
jgi:hypothetical protein